MTSSKAESKGMKVNSLKTNILTISDPLSYRPVAYIEGEQGELMESRPDGKLNVLGFTFANRATVRAHVNTVIKKIRQRFWTLYNL